MAVYFYPFKPSSSHNTVTIEGAVSVEQNEQTYIFTHSSEVGYIYITTCIVFCFKDNNIKLISEKYIYIYVYN